MQKLQNSVFSIVKTTSLSPAVFSFLQPATDSTDQTPLGGILRDTKYGWLALGPKFCVVDLRSGLKIAARNFEFYGISSNISVTSVVELPRPLIENSQQLIISLECDDTTGMICVLNINGSQLLRCIQTDVVITKLSLCDGVPVGPFECFDGLVMAGTRNGEIFVFDLNRNCLIQALKDIMNGYENHILGEGNAANLIFLPMKSIHKIQRQREQAVENNDHLAVLLNENSFVDGQYMFCNPDGTIRMKAKRDHIRVTVVEYIPQLGSLAVGFNFGAFQLWDLLALKLEFTSQVNVECLPVTHFGFQEPCDDPRAFCYLWVVFSVIDRLEDEEFPLAVMYSLTYLGKRMLSDTACLYQDFSTATVRFQIELGSVEDGIPLVGGRCISCHTYSINSNLSEEGEDTMLNLCQLVWECWGENINNTLQHGMLLFDLDQWYKDQMPATYNLESSPFMSTALSPELGRGINTLDLRLDPSTVSSYSHATRLEEHFYPNSLQYSCICLNTSEASVVHTVGIQRQIVRSMWEAGPGCLLRPARLHAACLAAGLTPLYGDTRPDLTPEDQRRFLLSVALEARLSRFLKRCAQDWATGTHSGVGCTLTFLTDWCWKRAIELKENAKEFTAPLFTSSIMPDKNVVRCLEHCVQQLSQLTGLLDAILTKCCNLVIPEALSEMEEKYKGVGTVSLYFQVVQWFLRVGLLPERAPPLPYPARQLTAAYYKRRLKLHRLQDKSPNEEVGNKPSELLYIDQLIENEFGGEAVYRSWRRASGAEGGGLYPAPSLCALARLYLRPDVHHDHKHALLLYLLLDYCALYDDIRYEAVIRRLMQFPTMFGLSNTAIKATQAFWHLDHRDFDFALDQLQCLTGNTLSDWQHKVVLSALLAQKKSQAALQYLHVRKPAPIQKMDKDTSIRMNEHDKLEDWQSCCNLYLARGLVFEALDVIRTCVKNAASIGDKTQVLNFFYKGCRNTGQLSKVLQVSLLPFEEEVFIKYLQDCNDVQTSDILLLYYLQQARYLEAEQYLGRVRRGAGGGDLSEAAAALVGVACRAVPRIAADVARAAALPMDQRVVAPKPMSVFIQAKSPKNTFTYKSSFIQDTIENASETWINKPKTRKGIKRALNIEETPFICTPKLSKTKSYLSSEDAAASSTPAKRAKLEPGGASGATAGAGGALSQQLAALLDMPDVPSPEHAPHRPDTPHSILKSRRGGVEAPSPVDSRYLGESDDELETASNHTHYSESKHLRFTIPMASESDSTSSPVAIPASSVHLTNEKVRVSEEREDNVDESNDLQESEESPPKKFAAEEIKPKKTFKDTVRARKSLSMSINSSLSEDPSSSIESIADLSVTLLNPRHPRHRRSPSRSPPREHHPHHTTTPQDTQEEPEAIRPDESLVPKSPQGRRSIRRTDESTPRPETAERQDSPIITPLRSGRITRMHSETPERQDTPIITPLRPSRVTRSRSRTPERSPKSPLDPIPEQPKQEVESEPHPTMSMLSAPRQLRSRSRTPERTDKSVVASPRLEAIVESPKSSESPQSSPARRNLRSRSRTPEVEVPVEIPQSPRVLRSRSKTPEKLMSPKKEQPVRSKKSLSRIVLEANTFAKTKQTEKMDIDTVEERDNAIECTPMKATNPGTSLMDVTFSPIVNKSVLQSSSESIFSMTTERTSKTDHDSDSSALKTLPPFTTLNEVYIEKSVLHSYESSVVETSSYTEKKIDESVTATVELKPLPAFTTIHEDFGKSVLKSCESSVAGTSAKETELEIPSFTSKSVNETVFGKSVLGSYDSSIISEDSKSKEIGVSMIDSNIMTSDSEVDTSNKNWKSEDNQDSAQDIQKEKERIVEIEREINEIEGEMSEDGCRVETDSGEEMNVEEESMESPEITSSEENDTASEEENSEVISIEDSDDSSSGRRLEIDEESSDAPVLRQNGYRLHIPTLEVGAPSDSNDALQIHLEEQATVQALLRSELSINDPLNQAHSSMLTDDNSVVESEQSASVSYSDENEAAPSDENEVEAGPSDENEVEAGPSDENEVEAGPSDENEVEAGPSDENEVEAVPSDLSDEQEIDADKDTEEIVTDIVMEEEIVPNEVAENVIEENIVMEEEIVQHEVVEKVIEENIATEEKIVEHEVAEEVIEENKMEEKEHVADNENEKEINIQHVEMEKKIEENKGTDKELEKEKETIVDKAIEEELITENDAVTSIDQTAQVITFEEQTTSKEVDEPMEEEPTANVQVATPPKTGEEDKMEVIEEVTTQEDQKVEDNQELKETKKETRSRKRSNSTTSNKSKDIEIEKEESRTPMTRKRSQSIASTSETQTPEAVKPEDSTPTPRRRAKTPSTEVRRILTRRASKELSESKIEEDAPDEVITPRRSARRSRKESKEDDNVSVASESSTKSTRSRASVDSEVKAAPVRRGRRSILSTKPDLSVIPETTTEEPSKENTQDIINEYSSARRMTRHQRALLDSWLEPDTPPRRSSRAEQTDTPTDSPALTDEEGLSETDGTMSPASTTSKPRPRLARAASETKAVSKPVRASRRISVDVVASPEVGSPSAGRGRRASALRTPPRRASVDQKTASESQDSELPSTSGTPARRSRHTSATTTTTSSASAKAEPGKRSKKTSEKDKEMKE